MTSATWQQILNKYMQLLLNNALANKRVGCRYSIANKRVGCRYSKRQPCNYDKYSILLESQTLREAQRTRCTLTKTPFVCLSELAQLSGLLCRGSAGLPCCGAAFESR
jgi:hypothetical protein